VDTHDKISSLLIVLLVVYLFPLLVVLAYHLILYIDMGHGRNTGTIMILVLALMILIVYCFSTSFRDQTADNPTLQKVRANFTLLNPKFAKIPLRVGDSAYTENKEVITLCLVDPETKYRYDINTIMYVAIHEVSHTITEEGKEEHGPEFKQNFARLLKDATLKGIYNPRLPIPPSYCNVKTR
jgi:hypothetical protein